MYLREIRTNFKIQIVGALVLGTALGYFTGYARLFTAPVFTYVANEIINPYLEPSVEYPVAAMIMIDSSHAFASAILMSVIGLLFLLLIFRIRTMFLPLVSCASFYLTSHWWFFSSLPSVFEKSSSSNILVALLSSLSAVLAWLFVSWALVRWVLPNKRKQSDAAEPRC